MIGPSAESITLGNRACRQIERHLDDLHASGYSTLGPLVEPKARELIDRIIDAGESSRPHCRLIRETLAVTGPDEVRVSIERLRPSTVAFALDGQGTWHAHPSEIDRAIQSFDFVVGLPDGLDDLDALARYLAGARSSRRVWINLGGSGSLIPLATYAGFGVSRDRIAGPLAIEVVMKARDRRVGELQIEGREPPLEISYRPGPPLLTRIARRSPADFFGRWLRGLLDAARQS